MGIFVKILGGLIMLCAIFSPALGKELINPPGCGAAPKWGSIVRDHAPLGTNPWLALIMFGTERYYVRLGENNQISDPDCEWHDGKRICAAPVRDFEVEKIIRHPEFDEPNFENDFALILLNQDVVYSEWVYPICICEDFEPSTLKIATYFHMMYISSFYNDLLQSTNEVEIIPSWNCKDVYPEITEKHHICTNYNSTYEKHDIGSPFIHYKGDGGKRYCLASLLKIDFNNNNPSQLLSCQLNWLESSMME